MFERLKNFLNSIVQKSGKIGSLFILLLITLVSFSVILRYVFSIGFIWLQDLYIWIHAIFVLLGLAYTLNADEHVRIDLLYRSFKKKIKKKINFFGTLLFGLPVSLIITFNGFEYFYRSFLLNESSKETGGLPFIFILKFFIFLTGILLFFEFFRQTFNFFRKK
ncbi:MAG: permease [Rickettsiales bacterium]|nr:permease [Rickettsiales bacterium]|tara:strand:+ start:51 stop:542 length:492 start_codon:yes stop_codon:yes gene_type:complete